MITFRSLILVGVGTFLIGVLIHPVIFPKPLKLKTFVPEGHADKVQDVSKSDPPPPQFQQPEEIETCQESVQDLQNRHLLLPVQGARFEDVKDTFSEARGGRVHEAVDILAPRDTPVVAVDEGKVVKFFYSVRGGITIYQFDPTETYCYYYAHLDRYASDIKEGDYVRRGQVIGYVGTSGNAPKDTPHLHFAIFKLNADKRWWEGTAIDPYPVLKKQ